MIQMLISVNPLAQLHWSCLDDAWVVYNQASGQTVLLDFLSAALLTALESGALDFDRLLARVAADYDLAESGALAPLLDDRLNQFLAMSWVEKHV